jgi:hypothetical protein
MDTTTHPAPEAHSMRHATTFVAVEASGPGAIAGFELRCDACGVVGRTSLESIARAVTSGPEAQYAAPDPATELDDEPEVELGEELAEAIEATLESFETLISALNWAGAGNDFFGRFRAYHMADLEGANGGWLGGPFLADALRQLKDGQF